MATFLYDGYCLYYTGTSAKPCARNNNLAPTCAKRSAGHSFACAYSFPRKGHVHCSHSLTCTQWLSVEIGRLLYNVRFHTLRAIPGPRIWASSDLLRYIAELRGVLDFTIRSFHETYGDVVRISPDALSFNDSDAWKDIQGQGEKQLHEGSCHAKHSSCRCEGTLTSTSRRR